MANSKIVPDPHGRPGHFLNTETGDVVSDGAPETDAKPSFDDDELTALFQTSEGHNEDIRTLCIGVQGLETRLKAAEDLLTTQASQVASQSGMIECLTAELSEAHKIVERVGLLEIGVEKLTSPVTPETPAETKAPTAAAAPAQSAK